MKISDVAHSTLLLYKFSMLSVKTALEYKLDRGLLAIAIFCRESISVVVLLLLLARFIHIRDWEMNELFFLYSFLFLSYSLFVFLFAGVRDFDGMVRTGELDRYLIRPQGLFFQIVASRVDLPATVGHGLVGVILFSQTAFSVGIKWDVAHIAYYIFALIGGTLITTSIFMISACFSFWLLKVDNLRNLVFFNARRIAGYPISFYPLVIQKFLIFVIPLSFVGYFPTQYFIRKDDHLTFWEGYYYITPVVGIIMFALSFLLWRIGLRSYSSSGNAM